MHSNIDIGEDASKPDWKLVKAFLLKEGMLKKEHVIQLCKTAIEIMSKNSKLIIILREGT